MRKFYIFSLLLSICFFAFACSAASGGKEILIKYISERTVSDKITVAKYDYSVEGSEWTEIEVWQKREGQIFILSVGSSSGNTVSLFKYDTASPTSFNFFNEHLNLQETVSSVRNASDRAVTLYLENTVE